MITNQSIVAITAELQEWDIGDTIEITQKQQVFIKNIIDALSYQLPLTVTEYVSYLDGAQGTYNDYELCPKCGRSLERTYQAHCDGCGQNLKWISKKLMTWKK